MDGNPANLLHSLPCPSGCASSSATLTPTMLWSRWHRWAAANIRNCKLARRLNSPLAQVTRAAIGNDCTLICGWSNQECARYLETFKRHAMQRTRYRRHLLAATDLDTKGNALMHLCRGL